MMHLILALIFLLVVFLVIAYLIKNVIKLSLIAATIAIVFYLGQSELIKEENIKPLKNLYTQIISHIK